MIEILNLATLSPAVITYMDGSVRKDTIVYIDYLSQKIIPTEELESLEDFRKAVFSFIIKSKKAVVVPTIPKSGFELGPTAFNNPD